LSRAVRNGTVGLKGSMEVALSHPRGYRIAQLLGITQIGGPAFSPGQVITVRGRIPGDAVFLLRVTDGKRVLRGVTVSHIPRSGTRLAVNRAAGLPVVKALGPGKPLIRNHRPVRIEGTVQSARHAHPSKSGADGSRR
jgi:hypothetical protein